MPLKCVKEKVKYRVVKRNTGLVRIGFCGNKVVEAKLLKVKKV